MQLYQRIEKSVNIITDLPEGVIVHDLSYDWQGRRIAVACSHKKVLVYGKNQQGYWDMQSQINIPGSAVWKAIWARPQFGSILATCSFDKIVRICEWKRIEGNHDYKYDWSISHVSNQNRTIEDLKFLPFKDQGLALGLVTANGFLKVFQVNNMIRLKQWSNISMLVHEIGLNCLSWSKNIIRQDMIIAVGIKDAQTTPRRVLNGMKQEPNGDPYKVENPISTIAFYSYKNKELTKLQHFIKQNRAVNDLSWAFMNGRSYYLLAVASVASMKIYELSIRQNANSIEVRKEIKLSDNPSYRISWNVVGTFVSVSEKTKVKIWKSTAKSIWTQINEIQES